MSDLESRRFQIKCCIILTIYVFFSIIFGVYKQYPEYKVYSNTKSVIYQVYEVGYNLKSIPDANYNPLFPKAINVEGVFKKDFTKQMNAVEKNSKPQNILIVTMTYLVSVMLFIWLLYLLN